MKIFTGKVISNKMTKTATVAVERIVAHPLYKKRIKTIKKYHVHDILGSKVGDIVRFIPSKPYSKLKRFKLVEIVSQKSPVKNADNPKEVTTVDSEIAVKNTKTASKKTEKKTTVKKSTAKERKAKK
jgi:small subunit ribosomal protein S17